jgi:hypothetical protein
VEEVQLAAPNKMRKHIRIKKKKALRFEINPLTIHIAEIRLCFTT